ncbi:MAG: gliding motility-associated C-terminal domain-containing protein [Bacteroidales bacterium]|nr:gliding motility-associated C-terminal domain-containing protein [Bacteroidales bacterium]
MLARRAPLFMLLTIWVVVLCAQYVGGAGGGFVISQVSQSVCGYAYPSIYAGGNEDGHSHQAIVQTNCNPASFPNIYAGGNDDGYNSSNVNQTSCAPPPFPNVYVGGNEDGHIMSSLSQVSCNPLIFPNIYAGGNQDGHIMEQVIQITCNPLAFPNVYAGGNDDGYLMASIVQTICNPPAPPPIYAGGNDDGFSMQLLAQVNCNPMAFPNIYAGGNNDGHMMEQISQVTCNPMAFPNIYAGGQNDGYDMRFLQQTSCNPFSFPNIYAGGNNDGFHMEFLPAGCYPYANFTANRTVICQGDTIYFYDQSMVLSTGPTAWNWNISGATYVQNPNAQNTYAVFGNAGTFNITLTAYYGPFGSTITKNNYITVHPLPNASITAGGPTTFCEGDSVLLTANPNGMTYQWNTGQTSQSIYAKTSGNYRVTVTSPQGCKNVSNVVTVTNLPAPKPLITTSGPPIVCTGNTIDLISSPAQSYLWIPTNQTTQQITVNTSGTYRVSVTYSNNCKRLSDPVTVTFGVSPAQPTITASGPLSFCNGDSVILTSSVASSYRWYPGGQTTQSIVVKTPGAYFVEVGNGTGCTSFSNPVNVTVLNSPPKPTITANGPLTFCLGDSVILTSSPEYGYRWYPTNDSTQTITVYNSGTYYVEVFNNIGCKNISDPVVVNAITPVSTPTITASGPLNICHGDSVILTSTPAPNYQWFPNGETTQSIVVRNPGTYYVMVGGGSCSAISNSLVVTVHPKPAKPTITASGPLTFCSGNSVILTSSSATGYLWNPTGQTTQSIVVTSSGQYFVDVNSGGSCSARSDTLTVTVIPSPATPVVTASGPTTFCVGDSVILTSSNASDYLWYPGGQTTQSITVKQSGNYYVRVGNGTSCYAFSQPISINVEAYPPVPTITASGPTTFCQGDSVILMSSPGISYHWSPTGDTTAYIVVRNGGTYYVEVGNICRTTSAPIQVNVLPSPSKPIITPLGSLNLCSGDSVILTTSLYDAYTWYPGNQQSQSITVTSGGMYYVRVYNNNGCSQISDPVFVNVYPRPSANVLGFSIACLSANENYTTYHLPNVSYLWTVNNGYVVSGNGTHDVLVHFYDTGYAYVGVHVTDINSGCSSYDSLEVRVLEAPTAFAGNDVSICKGDTIQLYGIGGVQMQWQPSLGLNDPSSSSPLASPPYTIDYVFATSNGSCVDYDTVRVNVVDRPHVDAGPDLMATQTDTCVMLQGFSLSPNVTYQWYPPYGLSNPQTPTPLACVNKDTTIYVLLVSNGICSSTDTVYVYLMRNQTPGDVSFVNSFSPNGDGINDVWMITNAEKYPKNKLSVYNRWGNKVYEAKPYLNDWDGTSIGKPLPDGTYYFVFDKGNGDPIIAGYVTIIRE